MKRGVVFLSILAMGLTSGCATNPEQIKSACVGSRTDIFQELTAGSPVPSGYADLRIVSSLKTHNPGIYSLEKKSHGTPDYKLLINIDGQVAEIAGVLREEDSEPRGLRDPEAGEGIRYSFRKEVRIKAGTHRIIIAVPEDNIAVERNLKLKEGSVNTLVLEPVYGATSPTGRPTYYSPTAFMCGVDGFRLILNGSIL
ncbi:MAG: hypothetical protein EG824_05365 [Deltaproteobacteria bacterium]|nr:hypothetical protein [Deltaproteobacteria bacterium]